LEHGWIIFHFIYGMSSANHWLSLHHFSRWVGWPPPTSNRYSHIYSHSYP
jgi:hypothetical protein